MTVSVSTEHRSGGLPYKWIVAGVIIFGLFMTILDSTIVNIAIPRLQNTFGATLTSVQWVLTAYTLMQGVATPLTAFLSQRLGQKRLYLLALTGFTIGSVLCGFAFNLPMLIFFRIVQGAMGAFMSPLAITLLYSEFPMEERGVALGALGIPILLAPAIGPTVGGYIVTFLGWQLIFFINLPIGIIGGILGVLFLHESRVEQRTPFDVPGFFLSALGLAALLYGISDANTDGWGSAKVLGFLAFGTLFLISFVVIELQTAAAGRQPLLDIRVFANGSFTTSTIASMFVIFALYGGLFILPIYLQDLRGLSAYQAGLLLLPQAFASMVASLVAGRLVDKVGVRLVVIPGLCILSLALWLFSSLSTTTPYQMIQFWLIIRSFALGFCFQPLSVAAFSEMRANRLPQATAVSTTVRFIISSLAVAVIATLVQSRTGFHYARLAEQVTATSPLGQFLLTLQGFFVFRGASLSAGYAAAIQEVSGMVRLQATILAMRDAFLVSLALTILAIIASCFVRSKRTGAPPILD
ncbi:MAG TPA: DHA2 family efflux MFS transporter permease subunit [Ktedonobacteraceae bacterium]|jgi:DHA2 family multidrug resistance protein